MSARQISVLGLLCTLVAGCASEPSAPAPPPSPPVSEAPPYDAALPPAQAALLLAPDEATNLRVVDWDVVRRDVGLPGLSSASTGADRVAFRRRTAVDTPVLDPPLLEGSDALLREDFGFGADDVSWEAHWSGPRVSGWALTFSPAVDMASVTRAVRAGVAPFRGASVRRADRLVVSGPSAGGLTWGAEPAWAPLVPDPGEAFVLRRGCVDVPGATVALEPISGYAVTFGDHVATVRLDRDRTDLFARARLRSDAFARVFRHPVADPSSGRIGYDVPRPPLAEPLVRRGDLPFGACAPGD